MVAHVCNPSGDWKDRGLRPDWAKKLARHHLNKEVVCGSHL
jgi:hypothetical protein